MIRQHGDHGGNIAAAATRFNRQPDRFITSACLAQIPELNYSRQGKFFAG